MSKNIEVSDICFSRLCSLKEGGRFQSFDDVLDYLLNMPMHRMSPRRLEVLKYVERGLSNKEIAAKMNLTEQTIKNHLTVIIKTLGATNRTNAVFLARQRGFLATGGG